MYMVKSMPYDTFDSRHPPIPAYHTPRIHQDQTWYFPMWAENGNAYDADYWIPATDWLLGLSLPDAPEAAVSPSSTHKSGFMVQAEPEKSCFPDTSNLYIVVGCRRGWGGGRRIERGKTSV